jgi:hypothetical protein
MYIARPFKILIAQVIALNKGLPKTLCVSHYASFPHTQMFTVGPRTSGHGAGRERYTESKLVSCSLC